MIITIILAEGMDEGLRLIHFLTLIVKCSETTVLDLSLWHQDGGAIRHSFNAVIDCVSERSS